MTEPIKERDRMINRVWLTLRVKTNAVTHCWLFQYAASYSSTAPVCIPVWSTFQCYLLSFFILLWIYGDRKYLNPSTAPPEKTRLGNKPVLFTSTHTPIVQQQPVTTRTARRWPQKANETFPKSGMQSKSHGDAISSTTDCIMENINLVSVLHHVLVDGVRFSPRTCPVSPQAVAEQEDNCAHSAQRFPL